MTPTLDKPYELPKNVENKRFTITGKVGAGISGELSKKIRDDNNKIPHPFLLKPADGYLIGR